MKRRRDTETTQVHEWNSGRCELRQDYLVAEEPLEIRIGGRPLMVTMRTPGHDRELAAGLLFTSGIIERREQILAIREPHDSKAAERGNILDFELAADVQFDWERQANRFGAASGCGICGKSSIDAVRSRISRRVNPNFRITAETLCQLPDALRSGQQVFSRTGGLHAAGIFDRAGKLIIEREDIGRHNAVDKIAGWALEENKLPLSDCTLIVSGRGGFEIVQKAAVAGIPVVGSVSACSSLAVKLAREAGMTLIGFLRGQHFVIYSGGEHLGLNTTQVPAASRFA